MAISILSLPRDVQLMVQAEIRDARHYEAASRCKYYAAHGLATPQEYYQYLLRTMKITNDTVNDAIEYTANLIANKYGVNALPNAMQCYRDMLAESMHQNDMDRKLDSQLLSY